MSRIIQQQHDNYQTYKVHGVLGTCHHKAVMKCKFSFECCVASSKQQIAPVCITKLSKASKCTVKDKSFSHCHAFKILIMASSVLQNEVRLSQIGII